MIDPEAKRPLEKEKIDQELEALRAERGQIELAAVVQERDMLRRVLDALPGLVAYVDRDQRYRLVNKRYTDWYGLSIETVLSRTVPEVIGEELYRSLVPYIQAALDGQAVVYEVDRDLKQNTIRTVQVRYDPDQDAEGNTRGYIVHVQDITQRKEAEAALLQAHRELDQRIKERTAALLELNDALSEQVSERLKIEQALRVSEARYRTLVDHFPNGAVMLLDRELRCVAAGGSDFHDASISAEEIHGRTLADILSPERSAALETHCAAVFSGERSIFRMTVSEREYEVYAVPVRDSADQVIACMIVAQNITERLRLETQLLHAQKMESLGRLAGGVAHDFNNLLTAILGYTDMASSYLEPDHAIQSHLGNVRLAAERAAELTQQLLAFARKQLIEPRIVDLNTLILETDRILRRLIGEDIELEIRLGNDLGKVRIDPGRFQQVILNLAVNARDAMPEGGKLTIETCNVELDAAYCAGAADLESGRYVQMCVTDTGIGIDREVLPHIFEPFFTTKGIGKGTGLGLATCFGIVKQNQGHIWAYSEQGVGTAFKIYLPCHRLEPASVPAAGRPPVEGGTETLLLAEDDPFVRKLAATALNHAGYRVLEASNGEEALVLAASYPGPIDLLLTDVIMPRLGGKLLAERLLQQTHHLKVLFVSGYTETSVPVVEILAEGIDFLQKPYLPDALLRKVRDLLDSATPRGN